jgi:hypothetical protein
MQTCSVRLVPKGAGELYCAPLDVINMQTTSDGLLLTDRATANLTRPKLAFITLCPRYPCQYLPCMQSRSSILGLG